MWLLIEPLDVLLFRESKPFTAGESFRAKSLFPPSPLPFLGAIRSKILVEQQVDLQEYKAAVEARARGESVKVPRLNALIEQIGGPDDYGRLQLIGPFLGKQVGKTVMPYFSLPLDLVVEKKSGSVAFLKPIKASWPGLQAIPPALRPLWTEVSGEAAKDRLLDATNLLSYLRGGSGISEEKTELWDTEIRVGIELSSRRTAEEGKLYTVEFTRLQGSPSAPIGFILKIHGLDEITFPSPGLFALGGEAHGASYKALPDDVLHPDFKSLMQGDDLKKVLVQKNHFKLYLATPAIFKNGWFPDFLQESNGEYRGRLGSLEFQLVAAAVEKSLPIGGWDLVHNRPRPMRKAVPPGSVYFFEKVGGPLSNEEVEKLFEAFHFKSLLRTIREDGTMSQGPPLASAGFGLALVGVWLQGGEWNV